MFISMDCFTFTLQKTKGMRYNQFYSELGKLLYAVADIDGKVTAKEKAMLKEVVHKELVPAEGHTDSFGTDAAYYTEFEFEIMEESKADPEAAFESFLNFLDNNKHEVSADMLRTARRSARKIAHTFSNINKKERDMLSRLSRKIAALLKEKD
jgi:hypothetical protein